MHLILYAYFPQYLLKNEVQNLLIWLVILNSICAILSVSNNTIRELEVKENVTVSTNSQELNFHCFLLLKKGTFYI